MCEASSTPGLIVAVKTYISGQTVPLIFNQMLDVIFWVPEMILLDNKYSLPIVTYSGV